MGFGDKGKPQFSEGPGLPTIFKNTGTAGKRRTPPVLSLVAGAS